MSAAGLPSEVDVVVIGAGISGLHTARNLLERGVERVVVVEARDRIGGRLRRVAVDEGRFLEAGGELVGPSTTAVNRLADEFGLERVDLPVEGKIVRITRGQRFEETFPFELDSGLGAAQAAAVGALDDLAATIPVEAPWTAPRAVEFDSMTLQTWIDQNVEAPIVADDMSRAFMYLGSMANELSLLYVLWFLRAVGFSAGMHEATSQRLRDGSSELVVRLAAAIGEERIVLGAPARTVRQDDGSVTVIADGGEVRAQVVVAAMAPQLCGRIEWEPRLAPRRDRLQDRYLSGHGQKLIARYADTWWRDRGLAGVGIGLPDGILMDVTDPAVGIPKLMSFPDPNVVMRGPHGPGLIDDRDARALFDAIVTTYLGEGAPEPLEFHNFSWLGDPWAMGCGSGLPPGVLTSVGDALYEPVGRIVWAGAETGMPFIDWIEGALLAGERAATEAAALVSR